MSKLKYIVLLVSAVMLGSSTFAQTKTSAKDAAIKQAIEAKHYKFVAQYADPQRGGHRYLNSDYDLRIRPDSVIAYLPYFGRGYFDIPYGSNDDGVKFTSTKFTYTSTVKKKGGWEVVIIPQDVKYMQKIILNISSNGNTYTQFQITNRDGIAFDGYIATKTNKEK